MENRRIKSFTDLIAWQKCHSLLILIYKITRSFPEDEKFGLTNQVRRATLSVTSNIAEGFGRNNVKEKTQFYGIAYGSLIEVQNQLLASRDVGYLNKQDFQEATILAIEAAKVLSGLRSANKRLEAEAKLKSNI